MVSPNARQLVDEGLRRMGIFNDVADRKIRNRMRNRQRREGGGDEGELDKGGRPPCPHQRLVSGLRPRKRKEPLIARREERKDKQDLADFRSHDRVF